MDKRGASKRGQITIFIILAIVIVAGIAGYLLLRDRITTGNIPEKFIPVEDYFLQCVEQQTKMGIGLMGEQAGYIYLPEFVPGSSYMPTSNMLNFLGSGVPYWYYVSGNNLVREQVPTKQEMEKQLARYIQETLHCDFSYFEERGYAVTLGEKSVETSIQDNQVSLKITADLSIDYENQSYLSREHDRVIKSNLGKNYNSANQIFNKEKSETFLENYALDVLYLYAPVDGVELSCSPKVWTLDSVQKQIKTALEANTIMLNSQDKYFNLNLENTRFVYSPDWPTKIEAGEDNVLIAEPVGNQPGLGILGFCYVPYHFVYDLAYPVLIQIYDGQELFQFPMVVIINNNLPRDADGEFRNVETEVCDYKNSAVRVNVYNTNLEPIDARISFKCLSQECDIGESLNGILISDFPKCINGFIMAKAEGYELKKQLASTNNEGSFNIILDRLYNVSFSLKASGKEVGELAIINFESSDTSKTIAWPEQRNLELTEGLYNISVYIYKNGSITIPGSQTEKCVDSLKPGLLGLFGATEKNCFTLDIPEQIISNVIFGGGRGEQYITESELQKGSLDILAETIPTPSNLEELQNSFNAIEDKNVYLEFK